mmetsp:Transcript_13590/g.34302  ORF Transcript_13590/g.34302 Transcript_13590/m.34302 type:complete len:259 (+) Transcript_13590:73-849(+)
MSGTNLSYASSQDAMKTSDDAASVQAAACLLLLLYRSFMCIYSSIVFGDSARHLVHAVCSLHTITHHSVHCCLLHQLLVPLGHQLARCRCKLPLISQQHRAGLCPQLLQHPPLKRHRMGRCQNRAHRGRSRLRATVSRQRCHRRTQHQGPGRWAKVGATHGAAADGRVVPRDLNAGVFLSLHPLQQLPKKAALLGGLDVAQHVSVAVIGWLAAGNPLPLLPVRNFTLRAAWGRCELRLMQCSAGRARGGRVGSAVTIR